LKIVVIRPHYVDAKFHLLAGCTRECNTELYHQYRLQQAMIASVFEREALVERHDYILAALIIFHHFAASMAHALMPLLQYAIAIRAAKERSRIDIYCHFAYYYFATLKFPS
jgi:hypothetical protein